MTYRAENYVANAEKRRKNKRQNSTKKIEGTPGWTALETKELKEEQVWKMDILSYIEVKKLKWYGNPQIADENSWRPVLTEHCSIGRKETDHEKT